MARTSLLSWMIGLGALFAAGAAAAQCCAPPPPPCCAPPPSCCTPPPPPPLPPTVPGHNVNIPGVNVFVAGSVVVNANANARASSGAAGQAGSTVFVGGGGGYGGGYAPPAPMGVIQGLNVGGGARRVAYQASRSRTARMIIQAVCIDDRFVAHPASQTTPDREIDDAFDGELYRCLAGTKMQYTYSEYLGQIDFTKGETRTCAKGEALYRTAAGRGGRMGEGGPGGPGRDQGQRSAGRGGDMAGGGESIGAQLGCRPQKPARDCNERSLLRRFGAGIKIITMSWFETYTAYREESYESATTTMSLDGGVGGVVY